MAKIYAKLKDAQQTSSSFEEDGGGDVDDDELYYSGTRDGEEEDEKNCSIDAILDAISELRDIFADLRPHERQNANAFNNIEQQCSIYLGYTRTQARNAEKGHLKEILIDKDGKYAKRRGNLWKDEYDADDDKMRANMELLLDVLIRKEALRRREKSKLEIPIHLLRQAKTAVPKDDEAGPKFVNLEELSLAQVCVVARELGFAHPLGTEAEKLKYINDACAFIGAFINRTKEQQKRVSFNIDDTYEIITSQGIQFITLNSAAVICHSTYSHTKSGKPTAEVREVGEYYHNSRVACHHSHL